jgi:hypothetical protein
MLSEDMVPTGAVLFFGTSPVNADLLLLSEQLKNRITSKE